MSNISPKILTVLSLLAAWSVAFGQEVRYSWLDISFVQQDVNIHTSLADIIIGQVVAIWSKDGDVIKLLGSVGT